MKKRLAALLMCLTIILSLVGAFTPGSAEAASVKLSKKKMTMYVYDLSKLTLNNATGTVKWKSSKTSVATVENGIVTAKKAGKATITATYKGKKYKCKVTVKKAKAFETAASAVKNMKIGFNIGNYFDASNETWYGKNPEEFMTGWGNPVIDENFIVKLKEYGFGAVRVPITWVYHFDDEGNIDPAWMAKVKEVVNWVLANDMYCIINVHHDTGSTGENMARWLFASSKNFGEQNGMFRVLWQNIAKEFKDYPQTLIFEGFNEMISEDNNWGEASDDAKQAINDYNQVFVNAVRSTSGNNLNRNLICTTYGGQIWESCIYYYSAPEDIVKDHLIGEVHYYQPYDWTMEDNNSPYGEWVEEIVDGDIAYVAEAFETRGPSRTPLPLIIGEFGSRDKNNNTKDRIKWHTRVISDAKAHGITCFIWDNGNCDDRSTAINGYLSRSGGGDIYGDIIKACVEAAE